MKSKNNESLRSRQTLLLQGSFDSKTENLICKPTTSQNTLNAHPRNGVSKTVRIHGNSKEKHNSPKPKLKIGSTIKLDNLPFLNNFKIHPGSLRNLHNLALCERNSPILSCQRLTAYPHTFKHK